MYAFNFKFSSDNKFQNENKDRNYFFAAASYREQILKLFVICKCVNCTIISEITK